MATLNIVSNLELLTDFRSGLRLVNQFLLDCTFDGSLVSDLDRESWKIVTLDDAMSECKNGLVYQKMPNPSGLPITRIETISDGTINFLRVGFGGITGESHLKYFLKDGDILFSHINSMEQIGKVAQYEKSMKPLLHGMNLLRITPSENFNPKFLYYILKTTQVRSQIIQKAKRAINQASINIKELKLVSVPMPPLEQQLRIVETVEKLLTICAKLDHNLAIRDELSLAFRNSVLDALAVAQTPDEFQTAWVRIQNNWEEIANSPESLDAIKSLILDLGVRGDLLVINKNHKPSSIEWSTSELKLDEPKLWSLPTLREKKKENWNRVPLAKIGTWGSGGTPSSTRKDFYEKGTIPWAVIGDLNNDVMLTTEKKITEQALRESSTKMVPKGAILIAMYATSIGKTAISGIDCCTNQAIAHCIVDSSIVSREYFFLVARSLRKHLIQKGKGAAQDNISQTVLKHLVIDLPPLEEQEEIAEKINFLFEICNQLSVALAQKARLIERYSRSEVAASV
jgi:restriction endonuclease S subunit